MNGGTRDTDGSWQSFIGFMKVTVRALLYLTFIAFSSCREEESKVDCPVDEAFCALVYEKDFNSTGPLIDAFLESMSGANRGEGMEKLKSWLECKSCVAGVVKFENSNDIIKVNPPLTEMYVVFMIDNKVVEMYLDLIVYLDPTADPPLKFKTFHD